LPATKESLFARLFVYPAVDVQRGFIALIGVSIAIFLCAFFKANIATATNFLITASLTVILMVGNTKLQQTLVLLAGGAIAFVYQIISLLILYHIGFSSIYVFPVLGVLLFILLCIPRIWSPLNMTCIVLSTILIMLVGFSHSSAYITQQDFHSSLALTAGFILVAIINLLFPTRAIVSPPIDQTFYFYKRNFRIALTVMLGMFLADAAHFMHAAWLGLTIVIVSRNNIGATVKIAMQRLVGTFLAVAAGIPAAYYLFLPHPDSRWIVILSLFAGLIIIKRHYDLGVFLLTFILAAAYIFILPDPNQIILIIADRLFETAVGVAFAIISEMILFPQSIIKMLRSEISLVWQKLTVIKTKLTAATFEELNSFLYDSSIRQSEMLEDFKFECLLFMSKRYKLVSLAINDFMSYANQVIEIANKYSEPKVDAWLMQHAIVAENMCEIFNSDLAERIAAIKAIQESLVIATDLSAEIQQCDEKLAALFREILSAMQTPWYKMF
jgi:hypothetical protein